MSEVARLVEVDPEVRIAVIVVNGKASALTGSLAPGHRRRVADRVMCLGVLLVRALVLVHHSDHAVLASPRIEWTNHNNKKVYHITFYL